MDPAQAALSELKRELRLLRGENAYLRDQLLQAGLHRGAPAPAPTLHAPHSDQGALPGTPGHPAGREQQLRAGEGLTRPASGAAVAPDAQPGSAPAPEELMRRLLDTQRMLVQFSRENDRLAGENGRLRSGRALVADSYQGRRGLPAVVQLVQWCSGAVIPAVPPPPASALLAGWTRQTQPCGWPDPDQLPPLPVRCAGALEEVDWLRGKLEVLETALRSGSLDSQALAGLTAGEGGQPGVLDAALAAVAGAGEGGEASSWLVAAEAEAAAAREELGGMAAEAVALSGNSPPDGLQPPAALPAEKDAAVAASTCFAQQEAVAEDSSTEVHNNHAWGVPTAAADVIVAAAGKEQSGGCMPDPGVLQDS